MESSKYSHKIYADKGETSDDGFDLIRIFSLMFPKWYLFIISLVLAYFCARTYIRHTLPVYMVSASILINERENNNAAINDQFLQGLGLPPGTQNIENQITVLSSRTLIERALNELPFDIDFYYRTLRNKLPIYPEVPFDISLISGDNLPRNVEFEFVHLGNNQFNLNTFHKEDIEFHLKASFGDTIEFDNKLIRVDLRDSIFLNQHINKKFYFIIHRRIDLVKDYKKRLKVASMSRDGTTIKISLEGTNRSKDVDFINTLTDMFISLSLDKKNLEATRRIQFIDNQLVGISDSLVLTENMLQQFRSRNRVMDLSSQGQAIITQSVALENERARIAVETNYYDYLTEYLAKEINDEVPVAPATMGITDPGLMRLVAEIGELQQQLSSRSLGELNPLQNQLIQRIQNTREALKETLNGLKRANTLAMEENRAQIQRLNNQAAALPGTERQLLGIERKYKLNDELYTFLLERRSEQQMQKASNTADNEVIDYANELDSIIVFPNMLAVYLIAWFLGMGFPFVIIFLMDFLNKTVQIDFIERLNDFSVAGKIPHNSLNTNIVVFENPDAGISEAFRILRSKMQFFTKEAKSPVILLTSALPEDGKTFIAINLASVFSLMGKKTVLVGFDLRKPKIFGDFDMDNEAGVSTWLIGKDKLQDIIKPTSYENLSIIPAGPVPPNPSELTALPKTDELFTLLRKHFDCIIIDSAPIGLVSDTYYLASQADSCLLVIRLAKTNKDILERTLDEIKITEFKSVSIVINDIPLEDTRYGYGGKSYGYTDLITKTRKRKFLTVITTKLRDLRKSRLKKDKYTSGITSIMSIIV
ncbi:MAG: polysaccharide biosynthesis tyrosine autokinase [Bacteroidales bacterium]|nr:polysaccharide biosynthesis tyrosine autokinase [Bacteroidales bacterium]